MPFRFGKLLARQVSKNLPIVATFHSVVQNGPQGVSCVVGTVNRVEFAQHKDAIIFFALFATVVRVLCM